MSEMPTRPVRVMFLVWGDSVHARRRIQLFIDDPAIEVAVVSTFDYGFAGAINIPLFAARNKASRPQQAADNVAAPAGYARSLHAWFAAFLPVRIAYDLIIGLVDWLTLRRHFRRFRPDVVFLQTLLYPSYLSYLLPRRVPVVVTFWNGDVTWWAQWNGIERLFKKWLVSHGANRASAITVNSQTAFEACLRYGVAADKVHLIRYPGVDIERFHPGDGRAAARARLGIRANRVVLCPRGIGQYLNSEIILQAAAEVIEEHPDTLFLFVSGNGYPEHLAEHQRIVRELGIAEHFRWDGQIPWEQMPDIYRAANVMVSISSNDSLPNCMLEAMACGTPVVMGDIPSIREWVADGINGLLVPPRDSNGVAAVLCRILTDADAAVGGYVQAGLNKVRCEADMRRNGRLALDLVRQVAALRTGDQRESA